MFVKASCMNSLNIWFIVMLSSSECICSGCPVGTTDFDPLHNRMPVTHIYMINIPMFMHYKQLGVSIGLMYQQCSKISMDVHKLLLASKMWVTHKSQSHTDYLGMNCVKKIIMKSSKLNFATLQSFFFICMFQLCMVGLNVVIKFSFILMIHLQTTCPCVVTD